MEMDPKDVERVARAICAVDGHDPDAEITAEDDSGWIKMKHWVWYEHEAKKHIAAISTMREGPASYRVRKLPAQPNRVSSRTVAIPRKPK